VLLGTVIVVATVDEAGNRRLQTRRLQVRRREAANKP